MLSAQDQRKREQKRLRKLEQREKQVSQKELSPSSNEKSGSSQGKTLMCTPSRLDLCLRKLSTSSTLNETVELITQLNDEAIKIKTSFEMTKKTIEEKNT